MDKNRVAIVTGGSRGIGRAVALRLAADGHRVVAGYAQDDAAADVTVDQISRSGGSAIAVRADVGDQRAVAALFDRAEAEFGGIDVVVNAAGRAKASTVADLDLEDLDAMHRTNIRGTFVVAQQAARRLRPGGSLATFSTSQVKLNFPTYGAYIASKSAVEGLSLVLARELRGRDITVNSIAPGATATELFLEGKDQGALDRLAQAAPLERLGTPEDIAEVVAFVVSPAGHWINGQVIRPNGGII